MALLIAPGVRVIDDDGNLISGGKIRVYDANTTDLSDLFSDEAMGPGSALPNPVIANAAGWPSSDGSTPTLIFTATGTYDVAFLDADDSVLAPFSDVSTFGEEGGELLREVPGGGRFLVTGSAGAVMIQVGDPSPDDTGGTVTLEGWGGTQADTITLDGALVNVSGRLKEQGKKLPSVVYTEATTFSAASEVLIALANDPTGVRAWEIEVFDLVLGAATGNILAQLSYDGGGTYKSGASDYLATTYHTNFTVVAVAGGTDIDVAVSAETSANRPGHILLRITTPDSGSQETVITAATHALNNGGTAPEEQRMTGYGVGGYGRATHLRLWLAGSTMTGKYLVRPLRGYGET